MVTFPEMPSLFFFFVTGSLLVNPFVPEIQGNCRLKTMSDDLLVSFTCLGHVIVRSGREMP